MTLGVWLRDARVGTLSADDANWIRFEVDEEYWERDPRPVISQALESDRGKRVTRGHMTLPPMFSNLLPEGALRELIAEHHGLDPRREMPLLARLGEDLAGALCFTEDGIGSGPPAPPVLVSDDEQWAFSALAGVQPKFTTERQGKSFVLAARGLGERWIVKVPDATFERVPETEELVTRWAQAAGIRTVEAMLVPRADIRGLPSGFASSEAMCFASKRYDRGPEVRVHQEDFCQVFNQRASERYRAATYDHLARAVMDLCGVDDAREMVRRLAFMVISGNTDLHLKNWSVVYQNPTRARLAPAYDLVSTIPFIKKRTAALQLGRGQALSELSLAHFQLLARGLEPIRDEVDGIVRETVQRAMAAWRDRFRRELVTAHATAIDAHLARCTLRTECDR